MIKLHAWWIFYKKILLSSLIVSLAVLIAGGAIGADLYSTLGISFAIVSPFAHLYLYELDKPNEYYFFANLGLYKPLLWICTGLISVLILILI